MKMHDMANPEMLLPPDVCYEDYILALKKIKPTVSEKDLEKQEEFTREFGQEG
jgi:vacuolar protein-sorting-associated protein 4